MDNQESLLTETAGEKSVERFPEKSVTAQTVEINIRYFSDLIFTNKAKL